MILNEINRTRASSRNSKITDSMIPLWLGPAILKTFGLRILTLVMWVIFINICCSKN